MKIPKIGKPSIPNYDGKDNWQDVICDRCGKSCLDVEGMNFEYATIEAYWGYGSRNKDAYHDVAQICEPCYDAIGVKPNRTTYM